MITDAEFERIFEEGLTLYRAQRFFAAHDKWEEAWKAVKQEKKREPAADPRRDFVHGLILLSVAYLHWQRGNPEGALRKYQESMRLLEPYPETFGGLRIPEVVQAAHRDFGRLAKDPAAPFLAERVVDLRRSP